MAMMLGGAPRAKAEAAAHLLTVPTDGVFAALQLHRRALVRWCERTDDDTRDEVLSSIANVALKRTTFSAGHALNGCGDAEAEGDTEAEGDAEAEGAAAKDAASTPSSAPALARTSPKQPLSSSSTRGWVSVSAKQLECEAVIETAHPYANVLLFVCLLSLFTNSFLSFSLPHTLMRIGIYIE